MYEIKKVKILSLKKFGENEILYKEQKKRKKKTEWFNSLESSMCVTMVTMSELFPMGLKSFQDESWSRLFEGL